MEEFLHYIWQHRLWSPQPVCQTVQGDELEIIEGGLPNTNAGPDFFNAKVKIGGTMWVGNVEIHSMASDWYRHGHHLDPKYDNVVLHVVEHADVQVTRRTDGTPIPQFILTYREETHERFRTLCEHTKSKPCLAVLPAIPRLKVHSWLSALQIERLEQKTEQINRWLEMCEKDWKRAFFVSLARSLGMSINSDVMERWALRIPLGALAKHRDNLLQVEALFLGLAGFLPEDQAEDEDETIKLYLREYLFLKHKFSLPAPVEETQWNMLRLHPSNFPQVRVAQLATLYHKHSDDFFSLMLEARNEKDVAGLLDVSLSPFWKRHYNLRQLSARSCDKHIGPTARRIVIINTLVPFMYTYGKHISNSALVSNAIKFMEQIPPEDNRILRAWRACGLVAQHAGDSQSLIQLERNYCERKDCLRCRFGFEYLRK